MTHRLHVHAQVVGRRIQPDLLFAQLALDDVAVADHEHDARQLVTDQHRDAEVNQLAIQRRRELRQRRRSALGPLEEHPRERHHRQAFAQQRGEVEPVEAAAPDHQHREHDEPEAEVLLDDRVLHQRQGLLLGAQKVGQRAVHDLDDDQARGQPERPRVLGAAEPPRPASTWMPMSNSTVTTSEAPVMPNTVVEYSCARVYALLPSATSL